MARDKVLSLISLATKAGRCASGEFLTESETKSGRAGLVVVAEDASGPSPINIPPLSYV